MLVCVWSSVFIVLANVFHLTINLIIFSLLWGPQVFGGGKHVFQFNTCLYLSAYSKGRMSTIGRLGVCKHNIRSWPPPLEFRDLWLLQAGKTQIPDWLIGSERALSALRFSQLHLRVYFLLHGENMNNLWGLYWWRIVTICHVSPKLTVLNLWGTTNANTVFRKWFFTFVTKCVIFKSETVE